MSKEDLNIGANINKIPSESLQTHESKNICVDINTPGLLLHGTRIKNLSSIFTQGLKPGTDVEDYGYSVVPGNISLSMVIGWYETSSSGVQYGAGDKRVSIVIDPEYVDAHKDQFLAVGKSFQADNPDFDVRTKDIAMLKEIKVRYIKDELYWYEVLCLYLPPDSLIGVVCDDPAMLDGIKAQLPPRPIIVYDSKGNILFENK